MRRVSVLAVVVEVAIASCGRLNFDGATDAATTGDDGGPTDPLLRELEILLHMDEAAWDGTTNEVVDASGRGHHGTANTGATTVLDPQRGRVGEFPSDACVLIPDAPELRPTTGVTISAWIFPTALDGVNAFGIVGKRVDFMGDSAYMLFLQTANHATIDIDSENDRTEGATAFANDAWRQLTVVFDGTTAVDLRVRFYVDGVLDAVRAESSATIPPFTPSVAVGCMPVQANQSFAGKLDDVAVWTRALTEAEVAAWYDTTK